MAVPVNWDVNINQNGAKQPVASSGCVVCYHKHSDDWLSQPLPRFPYGRTAHSVSSLSGDLCAFLSLPYEVPAHRPTIINQHLICLWRSHLTSTLSLFKCAKLRAKMLLSWRIKGITEHALWRCRKIGRWWGFQLAGAKSFPSWRWLLSVGPPGNLCPLLSILTIPHSTLSYPSFVLYEKSLLWFDNKLLLLLM